MVRKLLFIQFIALLVLPISLFAQVKITGKVTDAASGEELPGANVYLNEIKMGASADINGNYEIAIVRPGTYTLVASYVGYKQFKSQVTVGSSDIVNDIQMSPDFLGLEEIVVTGVGSETSKQKLGINVESVSTEKLTSAPALTVDAALTGKIAGATITQVSGQPGRSANIQLRGFATLGNSQPMIMIDGVQVNSGEIGLGGGNSSSALAEIDFNDIERIEVVKGAAASTIYGAQGANGVIQLFTKKGKSNKTNISYSSTFSFDSFTSTIDQADKHFYETDAEGFIIASSPYDDTEGKKRINEWLNDPRNVNRQYELAAYYSAAGDRDTKMDKPFKETTYKALDAVFRNPSTARHSLSISGGDSRFTYLLSANTQDQQGLERNTFFQRYAFRFNGDVKITDNLKASASTNFINTRQRGTISGGLITSPMSNALFNIQYMDMNKKDDAGNPVATLIRDDNSVNPLFQWDVRTPGSENIRFITSFNLNYKPFRFVEIDLKQGIDHARFDYTEVQRNFQDVTYARLTPAEGYVQEFSNKETIANTLVSAFLRFDLKEDFKSELPIRLQTQLSYDLRRTLNGSITSYGQGLPPFEIARSLAWTSNPIVDQFKSTFTTYGYLVNQKVEYGEWFATSFGGRVDYSSAFGQGQDPIFFPRADAYVRLSELGFWEGLKNVVTEAKVRAAYGQAGIQPGAFDRIITLNSGVIGTQGTFNPRSTLQNPLLNVEISTEFEYGLDLAFNGGKDFFSSIGTELTFWNRKSNDVIFGIDVAPSTGGAVSFNNGIDISSRGFDLSINTVVMNTKNFSWLATLNFGNSVTKIDNISNGQDIIVGNQYLLRKGERMGIHFGYRAMRSLNELSNPNDLTSAPILSADAQASGRYAVVDGKVIDLLTRQVQFRPYQEAIGDPTPDFTLSWRNEFTIMKNLSATVQIDWVQGVDLYNRTKQWMYRDFVHPDITKEVSMPALADGDPAKPGIQPDNNDVYQRGTGNDTGAFTSYYQSLYKTNDKTEFFIEDGSFIRLREVSITYNIGSLITSITKWNRLKSWNIGINARNLLTFTNYTGFDPEVSANGINNTVRGLDEFTYPNFRTISFTTSINF